MSGAPDTIAGLGVEVRALRDELRAYVERHDREHARLERAQAQLIEDVEHNTEWRQARQAQEVLLRWLVGSNVGVLIGVVVIIVDLVVHP